MVSSMSVKSLNDDLRKTPGLARSAAAGLRGLAGAAARQSVATAATPAPAAPGRDDRIFGLLGQIFDRLPVTPPNAATENRRQQP
jgi:hypothetical protein